MALPSNPLAGGVACITFTPGVPPILTELTPYFRDSTTAGLGGNFMRALRVLVMSFVLVAFARLALGWAVKSATPDMSQWQTMQPEEVPWNVNQGYQPPYPYGQGFQNPYPQQPFQRRW